jgi:RNA polymerase sigma-70 factor (ECF subfamily)
MSPAAVEQLVGAHREFLRFLETRVESRAAAEDILQSAFVKGLQQGQDIDEEKAVAWFYRVLRNAVVDHYRHRAASQRATDAFALEPREETDIPAILRDEVCRCLTALLPTLKPEYREALEIVDLDDASLSELARKTGISPENAAVRIHRARKALRREVEHACGTCATHGCFNCTCAGTGACS